MRKLRVLIACEESQAMCIAFRKRGCIAYSCDVQSCSGCHPEWHIKGDALRLIDNSKSHSFRVQSGSVCTVDHWDLLIAHPPCTYLSRAGGWKLHRDPARYALMMDARDFFLKFYTCDIPYIAIENPLPLKAACLPAPSTFVQPYHFGDPYSKLTCLWLKNLPPLFSTSICSEYVPFIGGACLAGYSHSDKRSRSKTFHGIAEACANQWTDFILNDRRLI